MGPLASVFSTIDSLRRRTKDAVLNPMESLYQGVRNFGSDWGKTLDTQAQAYPSIPRTPEQSLRLAQMVRTPEQARSEIADIGANMGMGAATVWHGSPHKFSKFDSSKIGTGEGAQAYGHGLYLAESPEVAKAYRSNLVKDPTFLEKKTGRVISKESPDYAELLDRQSRMERNGYGAEFDKKFEVQDGALYKVDLPDEHIAKMLDWDKPLSQQAPEVQAAVKAISPKNRSGQPMVDLDATGEELMRILGLGDGGASLLRQQGIPGIRYLDGGSRGAGSGTSNYVVFPGNEDILKILERNGIPLE